MPLATVVREFREGGIRLSYSFSLAVQARLPQLLNPRLFFHTEILLFPLQVYRRMLAPATKPNKHGSSTLLCNKNMFVA